MAKNIIFDDEIDSADGFRKWRYKVRGYSQFNADPVVVTLPGSLDLLLVNIYEVTSRNKLSGTRSKQSGTWYWIDEFNHGNHGKMSTKGVFYDKDGNIEKEDDDDYLDVDVDTGGGGEG